MGFFRILSIALIYCGTVFGAGFASGQEIVQFFSCFGMWGILCAVFTGIMFSAFGFAICYTAKQHSYIHVHSYFHLLFSKPVAKALQVISSTFLAVTFCIMITGSGALLFEQFFLPHVLGAVITLGLCFMIMKENVRGLALLNGVLTPLMFLGVTVMGVLLICGNNQTQMAGTKMVIPGFFSAVLYLSFNLISSTAVLVSASSLAKTPLAAGAGGVLGGVLIGIPLVLLTVSLTQNSSYFEKALPFFSLVCDAMPKLRYLCGGLLYSAMLTTAVSAGASVVMQGTQKKMRTRALLLCATALCASFIPFSVLVKTMYSAFGICGAILVFGIVKSFLRK